MSRLGVRNVKPWLGQGEDVDEQFAIKVPGSVNCWFLLNKEE